VSVAVVENEPGAASAIGIALVPRAKPHGKTLLWTTRARSRSRTVCCGGFTEAPGFGLEVDGQQVKPLTV